MKINSHNTFDPLKEIILGSVSLEVLNNEKDPRKRYILETVLNDTIEDLDRIEKIFQQFGVKVHRPDISNIDFSKKCSTPYFDINGHRIPLTPRDIFFTYNDTLLVTPNADQNRYFEHLPFNDILMYYMDHDSNVISMPMPTLENSIYEDMENIPEFGYYNNSFPMMSGANLQKYGKDIFYSNYNTINASALRWIKKQMGGQYRWHPLSDRVRGHLDACFNILKPGVVASVFEKSELPNYFANWTVITDQEGFKNRKYNELPEFISENVQDDDSEDSFFAMNMLCIDQEHVLVYDTTKASILKQLEKCGFTPVLTSFRHTHFLNQALSCITLDTVRDSQLEDYLL